MDVNIKDQGGDSEGRVPAWHEQSHRLSTESCEVTVFYISREAHSYFKEHLGNHNHLYLMLGRKVTF